MLLKTISKTFIAQAITAAFGLIFTVITARMLSPENFGDLRYLMIILPIIMVSTLPTFDNIILREAASGKKVNLLNILRVRQIFGCFGAIFFMFIGIIFLPNFNRELMVGFFASLILLPFYETMTGYKNYLIGVGLKNQALNILIRNKIISIVLVLISIFWYSQIGVTAYGLFIIFMISNTLPNIITFFGLRLKSRGSYLGATTKTKYIKEAIITSSASWVWLISYSFDKFYIEKKLGSESLAFYSILLLIPIILTQLIDALIPFYYRNIFYSKKPIISFKSSMYVFIALIFILIPYVIFSYIFYPIIFGSFYTYSLISLIISGMIIISGSLEFLFFHYLYKEKKDYQLFLYNMISLASLYIAFTSYTNIDLNIILIIISAKQLLLPSLFYLTIKTYKYKKSRS